MKRLGLYLLLVAILIRLLAWRLLPSVLADDAASFQEVATNLLHQQRFFGSEGLAFRSPVQPFFLFLVYRLIGENFIVAVIAQVILSVMTCLMVGNIAARIFSFRAGRIAAAICFLSFDLSLFAALLMSETVSVFLLVAGFWLWSKRKKNHITLFLSSLCWGIASLAKPTLLPVLVICSGILLLERKKRSGLIKLVFFTFLLLPSLLWSWRSSRALRSFVWVSTNGGLNFAIGNDPASGGTYNRETEKVTSLFAELGEAEKNKAFWQLGWQSVCKQPLAVIINTLKKPFYLFATFGGSAEGLIIREYPKKTLTLEKAAVVFFGMGQLLSYWLILLGAVYFLVHNLGRLKARRLVITILVFVIGYVVSFLPFFTFPRFRVILLPFLAIFAAEGWRQMKRGQRNFSFGKLWLPALFFILLTVRDWLKIIKLF